MIDWIDATCRSWGCCTRHLLSESASPADTSGFPTAEAIERARPALLEVRRRGLAQASSEERVAQAALVARAMQQSPAMPSALKIALWVHYVARPDPVQRAAVLGRHLGRREVLAREKYWRLLDRAHHFLLARIEPPGARQRGPQQAA